jgi:hypothetical protein
MTRDWVKCATPNTWLFFGIGARHFFSALHKPLTILNTCESFISEL